MLPVNIEQQFSFTYNSISFIIMSGKDLSHIAILHVDFMLSAYKSQSLWLQILDLTNRYYLNAWNYVGIHV